MKKSLLAIAVAVMATISASAAMVPLTQDNGTTAGKNTTISLKNASTQTSSSLADDGTVTIEVIPSLCSLPSATNSWLAYAVNGVSRIVTTGTLPEGRRTDPGDARFSPRFAAENLMSTTSAPFFRGSFSPTNTWIAEEGESICFWFKVKATGTNTTSLSRLSVTNNSNDSTNNSLKSVVTFGGANYSPIAPGFLTDDSSQRITSGSSTQPVKWFIVGVVVNSYPVSSTNGVNGVRNYINQFPWMNIRSVGNVGSVFASGLIAKYPQVLAAKVANGVLTIVADNEYSDPASYMVQVSDTSNIAGTWSDFTTIRAGQTLQIETIGGRIARFARYKQPN